MLDRNGGKHASAASQTSSEINQAISLSAAGDAAETVAANTASGANAVDSITTVAQQAAVTTKTPAKSAGVSRRNLFGVPPADGGVDVSQNAARSGGAISLDGASLKAAGAVSFAGNMATGGNGVGGAVSAVGANVEVDGASFDGNVAKSGMYVYECELRSQARS
jgi:hypothetical protein